MSKAAGGVKAAVEVLWRRRQEVARLVFHLAGGDEENNDAPDPMVWNLRKVTWGVNFDNFRKKNFCPVAQNQRT